MLSLLYRCDVEDCETAHSVAVDDTQVSGIIEAGDEVGDQLGREHAPAGWKIGRRPRKDGTVLVRCPEHAKAAR